MSNGRMGIIARDVRIVTAALSEVAALKTASAQGCAMALALAAAARVVRNGGTRDDYMNLVNAAWERVTNPGGRG